jgi:hydrogenase maturation protease
VTAGPLVIGYGNALRTDDGIGWHAAERLAADPRMDGVTVLRLHQLAPELALDFSRADFVVLIDASHLPAAGMFTVEAVTRAVSESTAWSHHLSPPSLIALAEELYGRCPQVFGFSVGVADVEVGERLSPQLAGALPLLVDAVAKFVVDRVEARVHA